MSLSLILALLKLASFLFNYFRDRGLIKQGEEAAIARATQALLLEVRKGKVVREDVQAQSDKQSSDLWDEMVKQKDDKK